MSSLNLIDSQRGIKLVYQNPNQLQQESRTSQDLPKQTCSRTIFSPCKALSITMRDSQTFLLPTRCSGTMIVRQESTFCKFFRSIWPIIHKMKVFLGYKKDHTRLTGRPRRSFNTTSRYTMWILLTSSMLNCNLETLKRYLHLRMHFQLPWSAKSLRHQYKRRTIQLLFQSIRTNSLSVGSSKSILITS